MDNATLTDSEGRKADFRNVILIMTSNLGVGQGSNIGFNQEKSDFKEEAINRFFAPEFINRLDDIVMFHRLEKSQIKDIVRIKLKGLIKTLEEKQIKLKVTEKAIDKIAEIGFDPHFGARPLQRVIQKEIENNVALKMIKGEIVPNSVVKVDYQNEGFIVENN